MSTIEELKVLLASYERLAAYTTDERRRQKLLEIMANIRSLLREQEESNEAVAANRQSKR
jgi:hypothetical protein